MADQTGDTEITQLQCILGALVWMDQQILDIQGGTDDVKFRSRKYYFVPKTTTFSWLVHSRSHIYTKLSYLRFDITVDNIVCMATLDAKTELLDVHLDKLWGQTSWGHF